MEGLSIIIPVYNKIGITLECIRDIQRNNINSTYEIILFDNGSTDETPYILSRDKDILYIRSDKNIGISEACNEGARRARYQFLCFMHNDLFIFGNEWVGKLVNFLQEKRDAGVIGLYGAREIRKDGSYRGKSIVYSMKDLSGIKGEFVRVVIVDGLLMTLRTEVFKEINGFNNAFKIHYYDKDISMKSLVMGYNNYVLLIPFEHRCGMTRKEIKGEDMVREKSKKVFLNIWRDNLPYSVMGIKDIFISIFQRAER